MKENIIKKMLVAYREDAISGTDADPKPSHRCRRIDRIDALAHAALKNCGVGEEQKEAYASAAESFKAAFYEHPSFDVLVRALISGGVDEVSKIKAAPGVQSCQCWENFRSMPTLVSSMHEHGASFKVDFKYDGMRCQVHVCSSGHVDSFQAQKAGTERFPDVVEAVRRNFKGTSCLDAEIVAVSSAPGEFTNTPFQRLTHNENLGKCKRDPRVLVHI